VAKRADLYKQIQQISYEQALIIPRVEPLGHVFKRAWIQGDVDNPVYPGSYYWNIQKANP
jgi:peptide/nickel transport system substrate-binding protein